MDYSKESITPLLNFIQNKEYNLILFIGEKDKTYFNFKNTNISFLFAYVNKIYENELSTDVDIISNIENNFLNSFDAIVVSSKIFNISDDITRSFIKKSSLLTSDIYIYHNDYDFVTKIDTISKYFAENSFIRDLKITDDCFTKFWKVNMKSISVMKVIEYYEKNIISKITEYEHSAYDISPECHDDNSDNYYASLYKNISKELNSLKYEMRLEKNRNRYLSEQNIHLATQYNAICNSRWWRFTKPGRIITKGMRKIPGFGSLIIALKVIKQGGFKSLADKIKYKKQLRKIIKRNSIMISHFLPAKLAVRQLNTTFEKDITFSILVPLFNTPAQFLKEMIDSCINQTYQKWELCLADASSDTNGEVYKICKSYMKKDNRIKYKKIENISISDNTNEAIKMATGNYISLLDHDDFLHPSALFENMLAITKKNADFIYTDEMTFDSNVFEPLVIHLKPDFSLDALRGNNYICHFTTFSKELLDKSGYFNPECNGSQDYDIILRLTENAKSIVHIPKILYYWRCHEGSVASDISVKPYCITSAIKALTNHLKRQKIDATVEAIPTIAGKYKINYAIKGNPLISIIIPNKDSYSYLSALIESILSKTTYENYEIIIVENNSTTNRIFDYYDELMQRHKNINVITWSGKFNYSAINNYATKYANGEYFLFLNNDMEVISPKWLEEMLMYAQRDNTGVVGAKLYYGDDTIQHGGVVITLNSTHIVALHYHKDLDKNDFGYMGRLIFAHNVSAVTGACMMMKKSIFNQVDGFDETFPVAFNDIDLCLKIRELGYLNVFTPFAELYHFESKSRGDDHDENNQISERLLEDISLFKKKWYKLMYLCDPYYNPNFSQTSDKFEFDIKPYSESQY